MQLNIKDKLKAYGNNGDEAILKEVIQLHTQQALMRYSRKKMAHEERRKVLRFHMFFKEKQDGTIKAKRMHRWQAPESIYE